MWFCDGPGTGSTVDVYKHSAVIRYGLQFEPLNTIFVAVPYQPRIAKIVKKLEKTVSVLKNEYLPMVCVIVTKFNIFRPCSDYTEEAMQAEIIKEIKATFMDVDKETIENVMFDKGEDSPAAA